MASGSKKVIYAAMIGNGLIAIAKFVGAAITGSSAMLSEGIHSLVDTGNQGLLLYGIKRSKRPADENHPFGYASEIYFWAFIVAILIFSIGAGISMYHGVEKVLHPHPVDNPVINYVILILAMIFEGFAWWIAYKEFNLTRGKKGIFQAVAESKDPTIFTVLFEDTAAMLGLIVALIGIWVSVTFNLPVIDGVASILIGVILAGTALLLALETKGLLIGEAAAPEIVSEIRELVADEKTIIGLNEIRTLHRGPNDVLLAISVDYRNDITAGDVERSNMVLGDRIKKQFPVVKRLFIEVQSKEDHAREMRMAEAARRAEAEE
ncbi:MAG: cation diffusion facilitator family transporter [Rhizobiaceae bacterium]|nr:cation diffusion facilitator family transporter [Rhizobiaceae bacterium]